MTDTEKAALERRIDELCAEVERLRQENQSIGMAAYELGRASLADENARLQKLTKWLLEFCHSDDSCGECEFRGECETGDNTDDYGFPMTCVAYDRILTEARELLGPDAVARYEKERREE